MRWLKEAARNRGEKSMGQRLAAECWMPAKSRRRGEEARGTHRMAEANKAFSHYRW
jgi:small subunit ribosomal protein S7